MIIARDIPTLENHLRAWRKEGESVGVVPTMGFFHEGHLQLMRRSLHLCDRTVVTIFVNPRQFGPQEDLQQYPRDFEGDAAKAEEVGVDLLFSPSPQEMYPEGYQTTVSVQTLSQGLCGASRPGHFDGVATVVAKLFNLVRPDIAVFGCKDYQQLALIKQLNADLHCDVEIIGHPTVREEDGLAMSSRNKYLGGSERKKAACLYQALTFAAQRITEKTEMPAEKLILEVESHLKDLEGCTIDYISVVHADTLAPKTIARKGDVLALAAYFGPGVRLIDNITL